MSALLNRAEVEAVVHAATLAPSVLNIQPWQFVGRSDGVIELHRDGTRLLRTLDPQHRALTISCGAALFNLRVAIGAFGHVPAVELLPDGERSTLLATVRVEAGGATVGEAPAPRGDRRLRQFLAERRTSRVPFVDQPIAPETVIQLEDAAAEERAALRVLSSYEAADVARLVHEADLVQRADRDLRAEIERWTRRGPDAVDGIPDISLGPAARDPSSLVRDFAMGAVLEERPRADFEPEPTLAVLLTHGDSPVDWLQAGQSLERVWLEATAAGLAMSLLTQPLELSNLRWLARPLTAPTPRPGARPTTHEPGSSRFWPQALMRLGVGLGWTPPTPRRPLPDVLRFVDVGTES